MFLILADFILTLLQLRQEVERLSQQNLGSSTSSISDSDLAQLRHECQVALKDKKDLEELLCQRESVIIDSSRKKDAEIDRLRDELASVRRDHSRMQAEQARALSEADRRASQLRESTKQGLASIAEARTLREQVKKMEEEERPVE